MNLRHSKPSYSYSESAPSPKISEIKVKEDPMLRFHAQLLVNFLEKSNFKYQEFQEKLRASRKKSKGKSSRLKKAGKEPAKKSKSKSRPKKQTNLFNMISKSKQDKRQIPDLAPANLKAEEAKQQDYQKPEQFQFPIDFLKMLLNLCGEVQSQQETANQLPSRSLRDNLEYLCSIHPEYVALLNQLYSRNYYIEGFHPSQLTTND